MGDRLSSPLRPDTTGKAPDLAYGTAEEFRHEQLLPTYVRSVTGKTAKWCIEWYFHPDAVSRVAALRRSREHLRLDAATGMSVWWRDHADHHMGVLLTPKDQRKHSMAGPAPHG